ncbi:MAG: biopolymer transporter ExbD [Planctomycetota bacterium]|nr:biopolymer transporter ExbD [Planctomycetota bacterium]MDA1140332.1 biopolymer transporter ExbD [Planctomycetota bacterium]
MKKRKLPEEAQEINLTPMIDVTFQLLIFFMVTSEMAKLDNIKELQLPKADKATPDESPPPDRLVINVLPRLEDKDGVKFIVGGDERDLDALTQLIYRESKLSRGKDDFSSRPVLIRADRNVSYRHIQQLMNLLMRERIWKLSFGAAKKDP